MVEAVAKAAGVPAAQVRRAAMVAGDLGLVAAAALAEGEEGLSEFGLTLLQPIQPMLAQSIAIYWGNPLVHLDFNTRSFVNVHEYPSDEAVTERIVELDRDDEQYLAVLAEPYYVDNRVNRYVDPERILARFRAIFTGALPGRDGGH